MEKFKSTYDDKISLICSVSLTVGTTLAIASTANKTQPQNVSTIMTAAKFTAIDAHTHTHTHDENDNNKNY